MATQRDLRKEAYQYILQIFSGISESENEENGDVSIPLEELRLIKEGIADPSPSLVALIKNLLGHTLSVSEIDAHLVTPFKNQNPE
jgi:hypothetical protein